MPAKQRILAQLTRPLIFRTSRYGIAAAIAALGSMSVIGALSSTPDSLNEAQWLVVSDLAINAQATAPADDLPFVREEPVKPGDTLRSLTQRLQIDDPSAINQLAESEVARDAMTQLSIGRPAVAMVTASGKLVRLTLPIGRSDERLRVERANDSLSIVRDAGPDVTQIEMREGVIASSLFAATDAADIPDTVASQLVELFSTEIDFHTDLRRGDQFRLIFEANHRDGRMVSAGQILAAEFVNAGQTHRVYRFQDSTGREDYYTDAGLSLRQGFLRSPLEFSRVTSGFSMRLHPILKTWRQHQGVDFGAPTGTAVKATADGTVEFAGTQRGYGNIVVLQHRDGYSTAYGHLSRLARGLTKNMAVNQGQIIGYVGQTGWATGPHLHYEFRERGTPRDPMTAALPPSRPITPREMTAFRKAVTPMQERLALLTRPAPAQTR